jgi:hypothetical protein
MVESNSDSLSRHLIVFFLSCGKLRSPRLVAMELMGRSICCGEACGAVVHTDYHRTGFVAFTSLLMLLSRGRWFTCKNDSGLVRYSVMVEHIGWVIQRGRDVRETCWAKHHDWY